MKLSPRQEAEAIEQFGDDMAKLVHGLDRLCDRMCPATIERINAIPQQGNLDTTIEAFRKLGDQLSRECDQAEEADDRRRDNPLEPDHRRLG
jgi:hypothetical protein